MCHISPGEMGEKERKIECSSLRIVNHRDRDNLFLTSKNWDKGRKLGSWGRTFLKIPRPNLTLSSFCFHYDQFFLLLFGVMIRFRVIGVRVRVRVIQLGLGLGLFK